MYVELEKKLRSFQAYTKFYTNEDIDIAAITSLKQHPVEDKNNTKSLAEPMPNQSVSLSVYDDLYWHDVGACSR